MTFSTLWALHAVIGAAIDDIEHVYRDRPQGSTLEYPSLEAPYYSTAQHTQDEELAEALKDDPAVVAASMRIVAACAQLSTTGEFSSAIRFLEAANIVEILREAGPGGLHVQEIHRLVLELRTNSKTAAPPDTVTPLTPAHLSHILRLLATGHYLREVSPDVFANNRASSYIDSGKTLSQLREAPEKKYDETDGIAASVGMAGDEVLKYTACLTEWVLPQRRTMASGRDTDSDANFHYRAPRPPKGPGQSAAAPPEGSVTHYETPFNLAFNTQLGLFPWLELPENEGRLVRFGHAMTGTGQRETKNQILQAFPWEDLPQGSVLVDVGGGIGSQSILVAEAHPHIRVVVEDREQVVSTARSAWGPQYASLFESGRIILTRLRAAAGPHTKLVIGDVLLPLACADETAYAAVDGASATSFPFVAKDSPLLPNLGVANILGYLTDMLMMNTFNAKERTVDEMMALTLSAGWEIVEIRRSPGSVWAYTTAVPRPFENAQNPSSDVPQRPRREQTRDTQRDEVPRAPGLRRTVHGLLVHIAPTQDGEVHERQCHRGALKLANEVAGRERTATVISAAQAETQRWSASSSESTKRRQRSQGTPVEFPSLDEPYYNTARHTPEEELAEALKGDPAVVTATVRIVAACAQLSTTVNKPWSGLMEELLWGQFASAIRFLEAAHIVEILREAGPAGLHVRDILRLVLDLRTNLKTAAPADTVPLTAAHLSHILRMLATGHYLREVQPDTFANNRASSYIDSGKTVAQLREARTGDLKLSNSV
ncbi:hypothetical protein V8D89_001361 [Ganoderma adspersum]